MLIEPAGAAVAIDNPERSLAPARSAKLRGRVTQQDGPDPSSPMGGHDVQREQLRHRRRSILIATGPEDRKREHDAALLRNQEMRRAVTIRSEMGFPADS